MKYQGTAMQGRRKDDGCPTITPAFPVQVKVGHPTISIRPMIAALSKVAQAQSGQPSLGPAGASIPSSASVISSVIVSHVYQRTGWGKQQDPFSFRQLLRARSVPRPVRFEMFGR